MKFDKGFKQLLMKTGVFVLLFILFSLVIGTQLYQFGLLDDWNIRIYGGIGYILLFSIAGFLLLYRERLFSLEYINHNKLDYFLFGLSFNLLILFYLFEKYAYLFEPNFISIILAHLLLLMTMISLVLGVFGTCFARKFIENFRKELVYFLIFGILAYSLMTWVWKLWKYFAWVVTKVVYFLLSQVGDPVLIDDYTLRFGGFAAKIAEACSGVYSIFLFTALYLFILFVDWNKINKKRAILLFLPAVIGAFFVNIFRVFILFLVGAYVSEKAAMGLYHSYTGMVFFLVYFGIFWRLFYKWMKKPEFRKEKKESWVKIQMNKLMSDSLFRNSIYLMINTLVMAGFGFLFWLIVTQLYSPESVGLATALISVMGIITGLSVMGLNVGLIRYLPNAKDKNKKINTSLTLVTISTIIFTSIFLMLSKYIAPKIVFVHDNIFLAFIFILFMIVSGFSAILDSVFIAYRNTRFIILKSTIFSILKLILPFFLVFFGAYGIFSSWMIALSIGVFVNVVVLIFKFNYFPKFVVYDSILKKIGKYSLGNYTAGFIGSLPAMVLPIIILNSLGAEQSAYYYISMMIAGLLFAIPQSTANSLFAEGSYKEKELKHQIKKSIKIISALLIPAILITIFLGSYVLGVFGKEYSSEGLRFLQLISISAVFVGLNYVFSSILRVRKKIRELISRNTIGALVILFLSYLFILSGYGLWGVGLAWMIGQIFISLSYAWLFFRGKRED